MRNASSKNATLCGLIQLRCDHYLVSAKSLQTQEIQTLYHLPLLGLTRLFPDATQRDIDSPFINILTTKALVQSTSPAERRGSRRLKASVFRLFSANWSVSRNDFFSVLRDSPVSSPLSVDHLPLPLSSNASFPLPVCLPM